MSAKTFWKSVNVDLRLLRLHNNLKLPLTTLNLTSTDPQVAYAEHFCPLLKVEPQPTR